MINWYSVSMLGKKYIERGARPDSLSTTSLSPKNLQGAVGKSGKN